ncbi:MAG: anhydro-N-acetylmuramic acid kinase [bacterium]|nr:anhydro-N-acetylmuramic acid kinase [bacterium]
MHPFVKLIKRREKLVVGLISGTSMDGIDAALVRLNGNGSATKIELLNFETFPYPDRLKANLLRIAQPGNGTVDEICWMNFVLGEYFADAVYGICNLARIDIHQVDLIGSHGQTIHHLPDQQTLFDKSIRATLQIGEPSVIANRTGVVTVANFRSADLALQGQGAPLIPYFDYLMFQSCTLNRIMLNIGGIANITILKKNTPIQEVSAYDTGPGNMVIDALMRQLYDKEFDENGLIARSGKVSEDLLSELFEHPFFCKPIPKSTGREEFGSSFVDNLIKSGARYKLSPEDIIATATELTARSIFDSLKFTSLRTDEVDELLISGGGSHNNAITESLKKYFSKSDVLRTDHYNIPVDAKEAICFAVLANETISGNPGNLPSVTGAARQAILGTISLVS